LNDTLLRIQDAVVEGQAGAVEQEIRAAIATGLEPRVILEEGLIAAMTVVGDEFEKGEIYVPEMLVAARAMQAGLSLLKPHLLELGVEPVGKVVIGTVQGDLHDIGKNLVGMMLQGAGYEIIDLGTDIPPAKFAEAVRMHRPVALGLSALLTTTMGNMRDAIEAIEDLGLRDQVKIIVGGAPLTEEFARSIGADAYGADASRAASVLRTLLQSSDLP
jgi:5-methyltetrahydrofolate--homocysteine methyltransferase